MNKLPHHTERARLPGIRRGGESPEKVKIIRQSRGTPLVGKTVTVFSHPVELLGSDRVTSRTINAIVDTGASYLTAPATLLAELGKNAQTGKPLYWPTEGKLNGTSGKSGYEQWGGRPQPP